MAKFVRRWSVTELRYVHRRRSIMAARSLSSSADVRHLHVPVLIVGAGPVGLVLSLLLTKLGVECAVIEKNRVFSQHPQAHFINNRSMELFRKLDCLAEDVQKLQPPLDLWRKFIYCTSLSGSVLGSVDHIQPQGVLLQDVCAYFLALLVIFLFSLNQNNAMHLTHYTFSPDFEKLVSPVSVAHLSQYKLVSLLLTKLKNLGFHVCTPDGFEGSSLDFIQEKRILMGLECISVNPTAEGVTVGVTFLNEGRLVERNFHCNILVGSDGARSTVRKLVGIEMKGERDLQNLVSIHFLSRNLGQYLQLQRPGMLFFIFNPEVIGVLVAHDLNQGEFVLQIPYYPPQQSFEDFSSKVCEQIIFKLVGRKLEDVRVVDIKPWTMHAEVAEEFVSCNNQVILAGDAAHRFPPAGGFGMNTGIQDAHNLAWKIGCLLKDAASPSIIQTYEMERKPIAISNTKLSIKNFKAAMSVPVALGLDPTVANAVHQVMNSSLGSVLPSSFQKAVLEGIFSIGRAQLSEYILNENNLLGASRLAKLRTIFDEGKSLQLQFPAEDLGFRYLQGALVADGDTETRETVETASSYNRRGARDYIPCSKPGSRLPHMQLRMLNASSSEDIISTLDLVPIDKLEFLLIIAPSKDSYDLARVAFKVAETYRVSLKVCVIWPKGSIPTFASGSGNELDPWKNYVDAEEVRRSESKSWWEMCQMTSKGVILVRPDDHIAWSTEIDAVESIVQQVDRVFSQILRVERTSS